MSYFSDPATGCRHSTGRPGQSYEMVPDGATTLTICSQRSGPTSGPARTRTATTAFADLQALLNAGSREPAPYRCDAGGLARTYSLDFAYATGTDVAVDVTPDCQPAVTNGSIRAASTPEIVSAIDRLIGLR